MKYNIWKELTSHRRVFSPQISILTVLHQILGHVALFFAIETLGSNASDVGFLGQIHLLFEDKERKIRNKNGRFWVRRSKYPRDQIVSDNMSVTVL